jgi:hypothetical protein
MEMQKGKWYNPRGLDMILKYEKHTGDIASNGHPVLEASEKYKNKSLIPGTGEWSNYNDPAKIDEATESQLKRHLPPEHPDYPPPPDIRELIAKELNGLQ